MSENITIIGDGGFSNVYLIDRGDEKFVRKVAISQLYNIEKEWSIMKKLKDVNGVPKAFRFGRGADRKKFIDFQYIPDVECLFDVKIKSEFQAFSICNQIIDVLIRAHSLGIYHRDIKRENILYNKKTGKVWVIDWGSACVLEGNAVGSAQAPSFEKKEMKTSTIAFTPASASLIETSMYDDDHYGTLQINPPEFFTREKSDFSKVDVWHVSILLYELLTNKDAFNREIKTENNGIHERIRRIINCEWDRESLLSPDYVKLFEGYLTKQEKRKSLTELYKDIIRVQ